MDRRRQRTAALQNLAVAMAARSARQRLGVRPSPAALALRPDEAHGSTMSDQSGTVQTSLGILKLEPGIPAFYFRHMKRIPFCIITLLCAIAPLRAQDARTEERLNKLSGQIEDLIAGQE